MHACHARVKAEAKRKFKVYQSAYANGWLVRTYKNVVVAINNA